MDKDLLDEGLLFIGFDDFFKRRESIKELFLTKNIKEQYIYKLYVYSRPFINDTYKDYIWDYLHDDITNAGLVHYYTFYKRRKHPE